MSRRPPLSPADRLRRDPAAQAVDLPGRRVLVRHAGGASILGGVAAADLRRLLDLADGRRSAGEIAELAAAGGGLDPALSPTRVLRLLEALEGEMVHRVEGTDRAPARPAVAERVAGIAAEAFEAPTAAEAVETSASSISSISSISSTEREIVVLGTGALARRIAEGAQDVRLEPRPPHRAESLPQAGPRGGGRRRAPRGL